MKNEIKLIDVNLILEAEGNPRANFSDVFLDGLAQSIARQGLINPITVASAGRDGCDVLGDVPCKEEIKKYAK